jgi:hypothetical protein
MDTLSTSGGEERDMLRLLVCSICVYRLEYTIPRKTIMMIIMMMVTICDVRRHLIIAGLYRVLYIRVRVLLHSIVLDLRRGN